MSETDDKKYHPPVLYTDGDISLFIEMNQTILTMSGNTLPGTAIPQVHRSKRLLRWLLAESTLLSVGCTQYPARDFYYQNQFVVWNRKWPRG